MPKKAIKSFFHVPTVKPPNSIEPTSVAYFQQGQWREQFNKDNKHTSVKSGICAALVFTWYDYLTKGKNLLDVLIKGAPEPVVKALVVLHHEIRASMFVLPDEINKILPLGMGHSLNEISRYAQEQFVKVDLNFTKDNFKKSIKAHMDELIAKQFHQHGFHALGYLEHPDVKKLSENGINLAGHIVGWTANDDGYLFFDANGGEMYFQSYEILVQFIQNRIEEFNSHELQTEIKPEFSLSFEDYYSEDDLEQMNRARYNSSY